jgi:hypothetical protein
MTSGASDWKPGLLDGTCGSIARIVDPEEATFFVTADQV